MKKIVIFGAGNIGRRVIEDLVFLDVFATLIEELKKSGRFTPRPVSHAAQDKIISGFRILNANDEEEVLSRLCDADFARTGG